MKNLLTIIGFCFCFGLSAQSYVFDYLNVNNINARFQSTGFMFSNPSTNNASYEYIQGSGKHTIYAGNIWISGLDANNQLRVAANMFFPQGEFYPGPVGSATTYATSHFDYNFVWKITKQEIDDFIAWYSCGLNPNCVQNSSYAVPNVIQNWPGNGDVSLGQSPIIAPFIDHNSDGIYNPIDGDYPCIKGDMALFTVYNDDYAHLNSGGDSLRMEIRAMHYGFNSPDSALASTIFSEYTLINFSNETYSDLNVGIWLDPDIGCSEDDYVGCDVQRSLSYAYNADLVDNNGCNGGSGFGHHPPAQGLVVLAEPLQDADNLDNSFGISVGESINGCGYGDGIIDNERVGMSSFIGYDRTLPPNTFGSPTSPLDFYNYMNGVWRDGTHLVYGGFGHSITAGSTTIETNYMFPGTSDNIYFFGTDGVDPGFDWSEETTGSGTSNPKGDRRTLTNMGPFSMQPNDIQQFTVAHITARDYLDSSNLASVALLKSYTDDIRNFYACEITNSCVSQISSINNYDNIQLSIYPNPATGIVNVSAEYKLESITIFSITGQQLIYKVNTDNSIDFSQLPKGIYLLKVEFENGKSVTKSVVKN